MLKISRGYLFLRLHIILATIAIVGGGIDAQEGRGTSALRGAYDLSVLKYTQFVRGLSMEKLELLISHPEVIPAAATATAIELRERGDIEEANRLVAKIYSIALTKIKAANQKEDTLWPAVRDACVWTIGILELKRKGAQWIVKHVTEVGYNKIFIEAAGLCGDDNTAKALSEIYRKVTIELETKQAEGPSHMVDERLTTLSRALAKTIVRSMDKLDEDALKAELLRIMQVPVNQKQWIPVHYVALELSGTGHQKALKFAAAELAAEYEKSKKHLSDALSVSELKDFDELNHKWSALRHLNRMYVDLSNGMREYVPIEKKDLSWLPENF